MKTLKSILAVAITCLSFLSAPSAKAGWIEGHFRNVEVYVDTIQGSRGFEYVEVSVTFQSSQKCTPSVDLKQGWATTVQSKKGRYGYYHTVVFYPVAADEAFYIKISGTNMKTFYSDTFWTPPVGPS